MGENSNYDFRTPLQKQQDERRQSIIAMFVDFRSKADSRTSDYRVMSVVAQKIGCTPQNVRAALIRENVITPKKRIRRVSAR